MSQPVKLSDELVRDARLAGTAAERSIAGQVEFWAKLGRSLEPLLEGHTVLSLSRAATARPLSELVDVVGTAEGREILSQYLASEPFPHYEPHPTQPGLLVRIDESGARTVGRFVNRAFVAQPAPSKHSSGSPANKSKPASAGLSVRSHTRAATPSPRPSRPKNA